MPVKETSDEEFLLEKVKEQLLTLVSQVLKLEARELDTDTDLSEYGFDSISFTDLINQVNRYYQLELTHDII